MKLSLSGLENNKKLKVEFNEAVKMPSEYGLVNSSPIVRFDGWIQKSEDLFILNGNLTSEISLSCGKCLTVVTVTVNDAAFERFSEKADSEDEDVWHIQSLSDFDISPQILLNLQMLIPMSVLCRDNCKGICRYCGVNLNDISCDCAELNREIDPRFANLKQLNFE
jgi:uncharacterized protein